MKIAIISDIHDNLVNLRQCLAWCKNEGVEKIICCGDIANGETLGVLAQEFSNEIFLVRGNMEIYGEDEIAAYENYTYGGRTAVWEIVGKKVGVCHEPFLIKEVLKSPLFRVPPLAKGSLPVLSARSERSRTAVEGGGVLQEENPDIIFYGHTHKPWIETKDGAQIVNPGTLGGVFSRATFAFWDTETGKLDLKILDLL